MRHLATFRGKIVGWRLYTCNVRGNRTRTIWTQRQPPRPPVSPWFTSPGPRGDVAREGTIKMLSLPDTPGVRVGIGITPTRLQAAWRSVLALQMPDTPGVRVGIGITPIRHQAAWRNALLALTSSEDGFRATIEDAKVLRSDSNFGTTFQLGDPSTRLSSGTEKCCKHAIQLFG